MLGNRKERRTNAMARLEAQLSSDLKPLKDENGRTVQGKHVKLTDKDKSRISKEIETLKSRV